jgi:hypothetical protein
MAEKAFDIIKGHGQWKNAVQGRLASGSFADACVGHVLGALENSQYRDNTIVVLCGDHGYDIGQKKFAKSALWEQTSRTPLIIYAPGVSERGAASAAPSPPPAERNSGGEGGVRGNAVKHFRSRIRENSGSLRYPPKSHDFGYGHSLRLFPHQQMLNGVG